MTNAKPIVSRTLIVLGLTVAVAAVLGLLYVARNLLMLVFGAILIAVVLNRLVQQLGRVLPDALSRRHRILLLFAALSVLVIGGIYGFANAATEQIIQLNDRIQEAIDTVVQAAEDQKIVERFLSGDSGLASILPSSAKSLGVAQKFFATAFGGVADCLILFILSIYFCVNPDRYRKGAIRLVPIGWRDKLSELLSESSETLWRWMLGRLLAMLLVGLCFGIGLAIIGIPMPLELGVFTAIVTFIPNIGGIAAVVPALLLAADQGKSSFIAVLVLYLTIQLAESYFFTPMVQQHQVSLPPALVILAQVVAGLLFGFWGVVFATPLVAVAVVWVRRVYVEGFLERADT